MANRRKIPLAEIRNRIHAARGVFKMKPREQPFVERMTELNREEKELEEKRCAQFSALGRSKQSRE